MKGKNKLRALKAAFPHTLPIMAGFLFLGFAYGVYMNVSGFSVWYPMIMSLTIFGGSLEFVAVSMLLSPFAPVQTLIMAFIIQARHLFYGISMLDRYKGTGLKKLYLIFGLCDETFSINFTADIPEGIDKGDFMFFVTLLHQIYWFTGATLGGLMGSHLPFDTAGLDFVMIAMFTVIFLDSLLREKKHISSLTGLVTALAALKIFGADNFMVPTMICVLTVLTLFRKPIERSLEE